MKKLILGFAFASTLIFSSCQDKDPSPDTNALEKEALEGYSELVYANYSDSYTAAKTMSDKIDAFLAAPSATTLKAAQESWKLARVPYGQTEAFRFYGGPIDGDNGPESYINGWPLDESYIDYVEGNATAGIINDATTYPTISKDVLVDLNEKNSETSLSTGWHAIEFLLWGQDLNPNGPGQRAFTDYTTAPNAARRTQYLKAVTELLLDNLAEVRDAWKPGATYRQEFTETADTQEMLSNVFRGLAALSKGELAGERMAVALANQDQEDEHSCFSDNTHMDIAMNFQGIKNVYTGRYSALDGTVQAGTSLSDLVKSVSSEKDKAIQDQLAATTTAVDAVVAAAPFDKLILNDSNQKITKAIDALRQLSDKIIDGAFALGIQVNGEV